ncbi:MAG: hypothetical protein DCC71_08130 [Proteobacteria bacterium]|nr:MAG: hypothetical protein DCC71_08130 [Pseudomonadota bacterium]
MPKTLLLADDSVTIQKVVGISFANEDVLLLTVDNGDDAVARAQEARPDLVLADIAMPGKDGYEVCEAIKSDPALRHVPVLLLSGTFESFDEERARRAGADGHITKPFEAQALVDRVNDLLARAEAERPVAGADTTVLVSERPPASEAFDFFDDEIAEAAPVAAATRLLDDADDMSPIPIETIDAEPVELEAAVEGEIDEPIAVPVTALPDARDGHTTVLFEEALAPPVAPAIATPPPVPPAVDFGTTLSSRAPLAPPVPDGAATRLLLEDEAEDAEGLDFGFEDAPIAAAPRDTAATERAFAAADEDPADELFESEIEPEQPPVQAAAAPAAAAARAPAPSSAHLEALRGELREHLEKVAWEAFGDLSERIVRETVARVEAVAWEVIPQMAETLIREEIRKLQGDE